MPMTTLFNNNRSQAVRLPAQARFPDGVKKVQVRVNGADRIISPVGQTWTQFFAQGPQVSDDFLVDRDQQVQADRETF